MMLSSGRICSVSVSCLQFVTQTLSRYLKCTCCGFFRRIARRPSPLQPPTPAWQPHLDRPCKAARIVRAAYPPQPHGHRASDRQRGSDAAQPARSQPLARATAAACGCSRRHARGGSRSLKDPVARIVSEVSPPPRCLIPLACRSLLRIAAAWFEVCHSAPTQGLGDRRIILQRVVNPGSARPLCNLAAATASGAGPTLSPRTHPQTIKQLLVCSRAQVRTLACPGSRRARQLAGTLSDAVAVVLTPPAQRPARGRLLGRAATPVAPCSIPPDAASAPTAE
eukprot:365968-Chlamydomonas_euryale.AAC.14